MESLDEFQTRHSTIEKRISETYLVGKKMIEYLEKQIILDFHFRGDQDQFEEQYSELKKKALQLLGYEFYYELSNFVGCPLTEDEYPLQYAKIMEIQKKLSAELDVVLKSHDIKLEKIQEPKQNPISKKEQINL